MVTSIRDADDKSSNPGLTLVESLPHQPTAIPDCYQEEEAEGFPLIPTFSVEELRQKQRLDPAINQVLVQMETGRTPPPSIKAEFPELPLLLLSLTGWSYGMECSINSGKMGPIPSLS